MSVIFDAMLITVLNERDAVRELNRLLHIKDEQRHQTFNPINTDGAGGSKVFTTHVYGAAFNHFLPDDVEECIAAAPWTAPQWVVYVRELGDYHYEEDSSLSARTVVELRASREDQANG